MLDQEILQRMSHGIHLYNEQKYWECHEVFEDLWATDAHDPIRNIYWAIIQVAAACIHYRDGNLVGSQGMISKAKEKFRRCRDLNLLSDLAFKYLDWNELESLVMAIPDGKDSKLDDFEKLFNFRFKSFRI